MLTVRMKSRSSRSAACSCCQRAGDGVLLLRLRRLLAQGRDLGVAQQHFVARVDQGDAVEDGFQLGGLVDHVHRRGDLAAVVQQAGQPQLLAVVVAHPEIGQRPRLRRVHGVGQHHRQLGHELAMASRVRRLFIDADIDQVDQRFEQLFQLRDQQLIRQRHGRLRGQRLDEALVGGGKGAHLARLAILGIDQLQHADQVALVVAHRHRQDRLRVVAVVAVELAHAGKIEGLVAVDVGDIHAAAHVRRIRGHRRQVGLVRAVEQGHARQAHVGALRDAQAVVDADVERQLAALARGPVQGGAIGAAHAFCQQHDALQQRADVVPLAAQAVAERDTEFGQLLQSVGDFLRVQLRHIGGNQVMGKQKRGSRQAPV